MAHYGGANTWIAACKSLDDLGQEGNPTHPDGLRDYIDALRAEGITDDEIDLMARRNPARLLGLE